MSRMMSKVQTLPLETKSSILLGDKSFWTSDIHDILLMNNFYTVSVIYDGRNDLL